MRPRTRQAHHPGECVPSKPILIAYSAPFLRVEHLRPSVPQIRTLEHAERQLRPDSRDYGVRSNRIGSICFHPNHCRRGERQSGVARGIGRHAVHISTRDCGAGLTVRDAVGGGLSDLDLCWADEAEDMRLAERVKGEEDFVVGVHALLAAANCSKRPVQQETPELRCGLRIAADSRDEKIIDR